MPTLSVIGVMFCSVRGIRYAYPDGTKSAWRSLDTAVSEVDETTWKTIYVAAKKPETWIEVD